MVWYSLLESSFISVKCFGELAAFGRLRPEKRDTIVQNAFCYGYSMLFLRWPENTLMVKRE